MSVRLVLILSALWCAASVAAGAFGAHALASRLTPERLELWRTAALYLMFSGLGGFASGLVRLSLNSSVGPAQTDLSGTALLLGGVIFSGTVFALALGSPRWFGAITPIGGALLILGFVTLAVWLVRTV